MTAHDQRYNDTSAKHASTETDQHKPVVSTSAPNGSASGSASLGESSLDRPEDMMKQGDGNNPDNTSIRHALGNPYEVAEYLEAIIREVEKGEHGYHFDDVNDWLVKPENAVVDDAPHAEVQKPDHMITAGAIIANLKNRIAAQEKREEKSKSRQAQEEAFETPATGPGL